MNKNYLFILFVFLANVIIITSQRVNISVNYNVNKEYSGSECGVNAEPFCTSLEDAGNRAISESVVNNSTPIFIYIHSNINGPAPASLGNLYSICGVVQILSPNSSIQFTIDGSNTNQSFFTIEEPTTNTTTTTCLIQRRVVVSNLKFINWNQTIFKVNINQETEQSPVDQSKNIALQISRTEVSYSSSIILVYPKNVNENYNYNSITVSATITAKHLSSSPNLVVPNSLDDLLPPLYIVGATVQDQVSLENSNISLTPFAYFESCYWKSATRSITNNTFSCNPFLFFVKSELSSLGPSTTFNNNEIMTFFYFSELQSSFVTYTPIASFTNFSTPINCYRDKYLNHQYHQAFTVFTKGNETLLEYYLNIADTDKKDTTFLYIEDAYLNFEFLVTHPPNYQFTNLFEIVNSSLKIININMSVYEFPIFGSNSSLLLDSYYINNTLIFKNETFCNCSNCTYYEFLNSNIKIIDTSFRYSLCNPEHSSTPLTTTTTTTTTTPTTTSTTTTSSTTPPPTTDSTTTTTTSTTTIDSTTTTTSIPTTTTTITTTSATTTSPIQTDTPSTLTVEPISIADSISKKSSIIRSSENIK
ncbi:hypothetical protein ACTFIU_007568 [Dictyostelium citrinum]